MLEGKCNGVACRENLSSNETLITYKRRKRARTAEIFPLENGGLSAEEVDNGKTNTHWRHVLSQMLQFTDDGGIKCCITDALIHLPSRNVPRTNMSDVKKAIIEPKHKCNDYVQTVDLSVSQPETAICEQPDADNNKLKCQKTFFNILCSEEFLLLCNLVCGGIKVNKLFNIEHMNLKMKSGVYGLSPGIFFDDLQQMWKDFQRVGEEIVALARSLSNMSKDNVNSNMDKDDLDMVHEVCPKQSKPNCRDSSATKKTDASGSGTEIIQFSDSVPNTKPNQTIVPMLYKACNCKKCGSTANVHNSLICDECESAYHLTCLNPAVQNIPSRSWYCDSCNTNKETTATESSEAPIVHGQNTIEEEGEEEEQQQHEEEEQEEEQEGENLHQNCKVCERLEIVTEAKEETQLTSRTALSRLCKHCGTCEDEDKRFLICGHSECPYKYYHIRCLKNSQVAGYQQRDMPYWYCPSCLCRGCFCDKDDDKIVLCDGCDEAHHIYCMKPPRASVPKGQWYCLQCNVEKAKEGVRRYEQWVLQQNGQKCDELTAARVKKKKDV